MKYLIPFILLGCSKPFPPPQPVDFHSVFVYFSADVNPDSISDQYVLEFELFRLSKHNQKQVLKAIVRDKVLKCIETKL